MLKKILWLLILIIFTSNFCIAKSNKNNLYEDVIKRGNMIVGISFDSKPFGFKDSNGQIKGFEADLAREIANRLLGDKNKVVFKDVTSQDRINAAMYGDVDMVISTMTINRQRKKFVDFSIPYFIAGQAICIKKGSKIDSIDDLINKRVIVVLGTTGEKNIKHFAPTAFIEGYANNSNAINAFKNNSGDAITTDDALLQGLVMESPDYMLLPKRLTKEPYGIAFKKSRRTNSFKHKVDEIIKEISLDGTLQSIKDKWLIY